MQRVLGFLFLSLILSSCTVGRWTVVDEYAVDTNSDPVVAEQRDILIVDEYPTVDKPVIGFEARQIVTKEYEQRVKVERTVQKYRPRWGFLIAALGGAALSVYTANSSALIPGASPAQRISLNATAGILAALAVTNLEPSGEPIQTGESQLMRSTGTEAIQDTTQSVRLDNLLSARVVVSYENTVLFEQSDIALSQNRLEINLGAFAEDLPDSINEQSELTVEVECADYNTSVSVLASDFLSRYITINTPITFLRNAPRENGANVLTEIGEGSQLEFLEKQEGWYKVRYREIEAYIEQSAGFVEWISTAESGPAVLVEFADVPFGEIDVEKAVPVLKSNNPNDRGLILSNGINNSMGNRQYLERDHRLFRFYLQSAFQLGEDQVVEYQNQNPEDWVSRLNNLPFMNGSGSLMVYLTGHAMVPHGGPGREIVLAHENEEGERSHISLQSVFELLSQTEPEFMYLFIDLQYHNGGQNGNGSSRNEERLLLNRVAEQFLDGNPNSVLIFSTLPGQKSHIYTGAADENKRHHIFNYYLAEALQQRKTGMEELIRHLESNVDYTARRLHDRPQEIRAYGNRELNLAN